MRDKEELFQILTDIDGQDFSEYQRLVGDFDFGRDLDALFGAASDDRFMIKVSYWLGL